MTTHASENQLDRRTAVPRLIGDPNDFLFVAGLAGTAKDIGSLTDDGPNSFLFGGAMGGATMAGLGLALAQPERRVIAATGDGDLLMSIGSLATIAALAPSNLCVLCVDNELYGETGSQRTHTSFTTDLAAVARGFGIPVVHSVRTEAELDGAAAAIRKSNGPVFIHLKVGGGAPPAHKKNWHADETKTAFRRALLNRR